MFIIATSTRTKGVRTRTASARALGALLLVAGAVSLASGCSVFLTKGPPPKGQRPPGFQCTESPRVPIADIALSVLSVAEIFHAASSDRTPIPWLATAVIFGASGGIGGARVNACNKAHGHPYSPHAPAGTPGMMPEDPFGFKGARPGKPPEPDQDDAKDDDEVVETAPKTP